MKSKVVWTSREWNLIAQRLVDCEVDPDRHGWRSQLIDAMKSTLPLDRWRDPANLNNAKDILKPLMKTIVTGPQHLPPKGPVTFVPEPPSVEKLSTEDLLVELARRVAKFVRVVEQLSDAKTMTTTPVDRGFHPTLKHNPEPQGFNRGVKPRIMVVGPRGEQIHRLTRLFSNVDLRFLVCEESPALLSTRSASCEEIILWTKFINHSHQDAAKLSGISTWYANSMQEIEARLEDWNKDK